MPFTIQLSSIYFRRFSWIKVFEVSILAAFIHLRILEPNRPPRISRIIPRAEFPTSHNTSQVVIPTVPAIANTMLEERR
jgi:hypothetical protein